MNYFVVIKEYADGRLKLLGKYEGEWNDDALGKVMREHRLYRGKWWVVEVHGDYAWVIEYSGRVISVGDSVQWYSQNEIEKLCRLLRMGKEVDAE